jgi:hypothetical protein
MPGSARVVPRSVRFQVVRARPKSKKADVLEYTLGIPARRLTLRSAARSCRVAARLVFQPDTIHPKALQSPLQDFSSESRAGAMLSGPGLHAAWAGTKRPRKHVPVQRLPMFATAAARHAFGALLFCKCDWSCRAPKAWHPSRHFAQELHEFIHGWVPDRFRHVIPARW